MEKDCKVTITISKILTEKEFENLHHKFIQQNVLNELKISSLDQSLVEIKKSKVKCKHKEKTLANFDAAIILNLVAAGVHEFVFDNYEISLAKKRYKIFVDNPSCVCCGITGSIMVLEKHVYENVPHFNLYAKKECGKKVLMTKDHIIPQSKGGTNENENLQTMCSECNNLKENTVISLEQI
jgi:hypothetical protein